MKGKLFLSIIAALAVAGTQAGAFGLDIDTDTNCDALGFEHDGTAEMNQEEYGITARWGFSGDGAYVCVDGFSWMGEGSMHMSFGSASGCGEDDFDFYYKTYGGFIEGSDQVSSTNFKAGKDDTYDDGFWYREGAFSSPVYYGDPENDGKRYSEDPNGAWPAWTWGHPEADPFVSAGDAGDDLGGAAGIGLGGFGMGDGNKIKADDGDIFYPLNYIEVNNYKNSSFGSYASDISWNVVIYDKNHNEVFKKNYTTTAYYWETINYQNSKYGLICPRSSVSEGEVVNDLAYNTAVRENIFSLWPDTGFDVDFIGDGAEDATACADPVKLKDTEMTDTFTVRRFPFGPEKKYEIRFDGPYIYDASAAGCPAVDERGIPDTEEKWPASCFKKVDTIWADEAGKTRAFMRMSISEVRDDSLCHMRLPEPPTPCHVDFKEKVKEAADRIEKSCQTTLERAKEEMEKSDDCDIQRIGG